MCEFMQENGGQVDLGGWLIGIQSEVPERAGQAAGLSQTAVEASADIVAARIGVCASLFVGKGIVIPGVGVLGVEEASFHKEWAGRSECRRGRRARQWLEAG